MATIRKIIHHHFGGIGNDQYASTQNLTEAHIRNAHRERFGADFGSLLSNEPIGYTVINWPWGLKQYRYIGEETAGAKGHNFDAFHYANAGNFMKGVDTMTSLQKENEKLLIRALMEGKPGSIGLKVLPGTELAFNAFDIGPHRAYAPKGYTQCDGDQFDENRVRRIALEYLAEKYQHIKIALQFIKSLISSHTPKLTGDDRDDEGIL